MPLSWWTDVEPATLAREYSFFRVNNETDIAHIIRPPNAEDNDPVALARIVDGGRTPPPVAVGGVFGKLVSVGFVHTVYNNGTLELMPPGRYWMCSCMSSWGRRHALGEDAIVEATLSVLRVRRGQIGLAMENGKPVKRQVMQKLDEIGFEVLKVTTVGGHVVGFDIRNRSHHRLQVHE